MSIPPPRRVVEAFLQPVSNVQRRIEIYESDGIIPWKPHLWDEIFVSGGGSVSANYGEKERRTFECELDNHDGELDPVPGGLWYDKIFKVFYGIDVNGSNDNQPRILILEEDGTTGEAQNLRAAFYESGFTNVHFNPAASRDDVEAADILVSVSLDGGKKSALLNSSWMEGKSVLTFAGNASPSKFTNIIATLQSATSGEDYIQVEPQNSTLYSTATQWNTKVASAYRRVALPALNTTVMADAIRVSGETTTASPHVIASTVGGRGSWVHVMQHNFARETFADANGVPSTDSFNSFKQFLTSTVEYMYGTSNDDYYECQIGEFVSSSIGHANESGDTVSVSCIDYTKRCSDSKLAAATMFEEGEILEDVVKAVASNCGIRKFNMPVTGEGLQKDIVFERDTTRWDVMFKMTSELGYDLYFDGEGRLTIKKLVDPAQDSPNLVLRSGIGGNLVSRRLATSDSRLFNHVVIVGESSDANAAPVWGEAINREAASPTSVDKIGDRVKIETLSTITSRDKAVEVAEQMLAVSILEEFDLSFVSVFFPWIEPGELVEYVDETRAHWGPSRYLITALSLPLDLGPMSGTGKRVVNLS